MNARTIFPAVLANAIADATNPELIERLAQLDRSVDRLDGERDLHRIGTGNYAATTVQHAAAEAEQAQVEAELRARFAGWSGGADMLQLAERLA